MKNLALLRAEFGLSQQKLAEQIGEVSQQSIHKYETGSAEPDIETLIRLADYFNTTVDFLIGNSEIREKGSKITDYELSEKHLQHLKNYLQLSDKSQRIVDILVVELAKD